MKMNLALKEIAEAVEGTIEATGPPATGVSTDTRALKPGDLFFALFGEGAKPGNAGDGHRFVPDAAQRGAAGAVLSQTVTDLPAHFGLVRVPDTLAALGKLAAAWRQRMPARIAAVTGSVGKTSTKGMLGSILAAAAPSVVAERSYNNEIGVPLTLLQLARQHAYCALEFAMRGPGEIGYLTRLARPEVGIITNIGASHAGRLGSREATARAKGELLPLLPRTGAAVLKRSDFFFPVLSELSAGRVLSFDLEGDADVRAQSIEEHGLESVSFDCVLPHARVHVRLGVPGRHNVENALAAAAAAHALGLDATSIGAGLSQYAGTEMRTRVLHTAEGVTIIDDSYNAAPASVQAALRLLAAVRGRRIFVFGDMLELGEEGPEAHREVGAEAAGAGVSRMLLVGELAKLAAESAGEAGVHATCHDALEAVVAALRSELCAGDTVLVKGSRMMQLERVTEGLLSDA
jgi:UDP-N-acetylmuramoyl-tripeptide--D-alanyl-D-alanine ligase